VIRESKHGEKQTIGMFLFSYVCSKFWHAACLLLEVLSKMIDKSFFFFFFVRRGGGGGGGGVGAGLEGGRDYHILAFKG
jgi:hypothetical protein